MLRSSLPAVLFGLALFLSPTAEAQTSAEAVDKVRAEYVAAFNAGDAESLAKLYAEDGILLPASGARIIGRDAIEQHLRSDFEAGASDLKVEPQGAQQIGSAFYDIGRYSMTVPSSAGQKTSINGNYLVLLQPTEDELKIKVLIGNMQP
jgi:uncharacterized protein (TIGR02246 family)